MILVVGASGATGQLLVKQLLDMNQPVRVIVRSLDRLPDFFHDDDNVEIVRASVLALSDAEMVQCVEGCRAVASCLGHTMSLKGIFGPPRRLVSEATRRLCEAVRESRLRDSSGMVRSPVKFVLMNTAGNRDVDESVSTVQAVVVGLIRLLVPPHADNEAAADYLQSAVGSGDRLIEWVAVRPDSLIDRAEVSEYDVYSSPIRSAIFDPGCTSRIDVGHFMASLISGDRLWEQWKGTMPVIYSNAH